MLKAAILALASTVIAIAATPGSAMSPFKLEKHVVPMGGDVLPMGIYYTRVKVGSPAREFVVSIDTGSTDLLIPGNECNGCNVTTREFKSSRRSFVRELCELTPPSLLPSFPPSLPLSCCPPQTAKYDPSSSNYSTPVKCHENDCIRKGKKQTSCWTQNGQEDLCPFSDVYLTCDLSNLTALCTVAGPLYRDVVEISGFTSSAPVKLGMIMNQTTNFDQFKLIDVGVVVQLIGRGMKD